MKSFIFFILSIFIVSFPDLQAQNKRAVDFTKVKAIISFDTINQSVSGKVEYIFDVNAPVDSLVLDAAQMQFGNVKINHNEVAFKASENNLVAFKKLTPAAGQRLSFTYTATPKKALYFTGWNNTASGQIWTQGQGKNTSNWLPVVDEFAEKIIPEFTLNFHADYTVIANGKLLDTLKTGNQKTWHYALNKPVSSYLLALAIGKFQHQKQKSDSQIIIENYFENNDAERATPTYADSKQIFDFLEKNIGIPYPFEVYRQVPVRDFLYAGMENATLTIFSDDLLVDSIAKNDKNFFNVSAHELAHHWFGNLVTAQSGLHHWLQEGFSTYFAWKTEKALLGDATYYQKLYESYLTLKLQNSSGKGEPVLIENGSSLTYYDKGAWALLYLEKAIGKEKFQLAVRNYLTRYAYKTATTDDFLKEVALVSQLNTTDFKEQWLENKMFKADEARQLLNYEPIKLLENLDCNADLSDCLQVFKEQPFLPAVQKVTSAITQHPDATKIDALKKYLTHAKLPGKRAVALAADSIPPDLQPAFEKLLNLHSYDAIEETLYKLWKFFPDKRNFYLEKTDGIYGHRNFNIRQLWLVLSLVTEDFRPEDKKAFYEELTAYTGSYFDYSIREIAFQYIFDLKLISPVYLDNLLNATRHWIWQFSKDAKEKLMQLLNEPDYRTYYEQNLSKFSRSEQAYLNSVLKP